MILFPRGTRTNPLLFDRTSENPCVASVLAQSWYRTEHVVGHPNAHAGCSSAMRAMHLWVVLALLDVAAAVVHLHMNQSLIAEERGSRAGLLAWI